jgi:hypothetical protein
MSRNHLSALHSISLKKIQNDSSEEELVTKSAKWCGLEAKGIITPNELGENLHIRSLFSCYLSALIEGQICTSHSLHMVKWLI